MLALYFLTGIVIVLILRILDRYFTRYLFSPTSLTIGTFVYNYPILAAFIPFGASLALYGSTGANHQELSIVPGFISSLLITWPYFYAPEIIPLTLAKRKREIYTSSILFIASYSSLSYAGGIINKDFFTGLLFLILGTIILITRKFIKL